jgi:hypothetical protein
LDEKDEGDPHLLAAVVNFLPMASIGVVMPIKM